MQGFFSRHPNDPWSPQWMLGDFGILFIDCIASFSIVYQNQDCFGVFRDLSRRFRDFSGLLQDCFSCLGDPSWDFVIFKVFFFKFWSEFEGNGSSELVILKDSKRGTISACFRIFPGDLGIFQDCFSRLENLSWDLVIFLRILSIFDWILRKWIVWIDDAEGFKRIL